MLRARLIELCENMSKVEAQLDELEIELGTGHAAVDHAKATLQEVVLSFTAEVLKREGT